MTTYKQKFDDLFETCVTSARNSFMKDGELRTHWIVEDKNGTRILLAFDPNISKDAMVKKMREMAADKGIVRYVVEMEAWMGVGDGPLPSERPERMEAIVVMGADRQGHASIVSIEIERKDGKHYLGETMRTDDDTCISGPFHIFEERENQ